MRLVTFQAESGPRPAALQAGLVIDLATLSGGELPTSMLELIEAGPPAWERARSLLLRSGSPRGAVPLESVRLLAPIPLPRRNILCVGWNYAQHFQEAQGMRGGPAQQPQELPEYPTLFTKAPQTVVGPEAGVEFDPRISEKLDWEVELTVIVGRPGRDIPAEWAMQHVFGYTVGNDVSARDVQRRHGGQWFKGKSGDTHCPMGPWIVTADDLPDPHALRITSRINGVTKQDSNTRFMVFKIQRIVEEFSRGATLLAGDIIMTGTPEGVGFARNPPEYLKPGDLMEMEIESIGVLRNPVVEYHP